MRLSSLVALLLPAACLAAVHVAPSGSDTNPGTADKPVATLNRAIDLAATDKQILLHDGAFHDTTITLSAKHSGLTIEPAPGAKPTLFGGIPLAGWQKLDDRLVFCPLPAGRELQPRMLLVNGRYAPRARYPEQGVLSHLSTFNIPWMSSTGGGWKRKPTQEELTTLRYKPGDIPAGLDIRSAEITVYHMWDESVTGIAAHDPATQTLRLSPATGHPPGAFNVKKYVLWNIPQGLTRPGQWYHDRTQNRIVYWPLPGEEMGRASVIVPTVPTVIRIEGTQASPARDITLRGFTVSVTNAPLITGGFAAGNFDGAISLNQTDNIRIENLTVTGVQGHAINARRGCNATRIANCEISNSGAGGIYVGGTNAVITNNHVHAVGLAYPSSIGIYRGGGRNNTVSHNEVHNTPYSAINYGGQDNVIEYNLIYDCMKVLHDGAAIYVFAAKNTVLRGNVARDIPDTGGYGSSAYYLDERSEGCIVEGNLSINVQRPSHNHMALKNTIRNNVFIHEGDMRVTFPRSTEFAMEGNVLYATGKIRIDNPTGVTTWKNNVLFSGTGTIEGIKLADYSEAGATARPAGESILADPMFIDLKNGDYRYRPGSPAAKLGLKPIDAARAGRR